MHVIIKSHLNQFSKNFALDNLAESHQFERFSNYCIASDRSSEKVLLDEITTGADDAGIDGVIFLIDGEIITSPEAAQDILSRPKKNIVAEIIFIQSKSSENFEKAQISNFGDGISDLISESTELPICETLQNAKEIIKIILQNIGKVEDGQPIASAYYVTTGEYNESAKEIKAALTLLKKKIDSTGFFSSANVYPIGRKELIKLYSKISSGVEATLEVKGFLPYPTIPGVEEAYLALVPAKSYVEKLLNDNGKIRASVFEENVRAYLGSDNPVNSEISKTISDTIRRQRFGVLNNGITIVSPDIRVQNNNIFLRDYQIVNGCQTSNVLFENRDSLSDDVFLTVKMVEANDSDVVDDVVKSTNSQTRVESIQFLSSIPIIKQVERYFSARNENNEETAIYLERREKQYSGRGIPEIRIVDIKNMCRSTAAIFLDKPELASRYPIQMFDEVGDELLSEKNREIIYYTSALAHYRIQLLLASQRIPSNLGKCRWHILMLLKYLSNKNKPTPKLNSKKIDKYCENIIAACRDPEFTKFKEAAHILQNSGDLARDTIRLHSFKTQLITMISP
ncbi:MAG: AIPR family protein [Pseudomonas sp.]